MITGDNPLTAAAIAAEAGVDDFLAQATPEAKLKLINTGGGTFDSGGTKVRSMTLGSGMATAPAVSFNPYTNQPDLYVTLSGGGGTGASTIRGPVTPGNFSNRTNILYWRDRRMQQ